MSSEPGTTAEALERGRAAFARSAFAEAFASLREAAADPSISLDDLEHLAVSAELTGRGAETHETMARAVHLALQAGDPARAAYLAFWLGFSLLDKGEPAKGNGWFRRAASIIEESGVDSVASGWVILPRAIHLAESGDPAAALQQFAEVSAIASRFGDVDLATFGRLGRGTSLIALGDIEAGVALLDEAMVAVSEGEVSPVVVGIVYCATIERCRAIFDVRRAQEWTAALDRWCEAHPDIVPFRGQCRLFRADLLRLHGDWDGAELETRRARIILEAPPPHPELGEALYQEAELHRLRGEVDAAERAYHDAAAWGHSAEPGRALARLAIGRIHDARADIEAALEGAHDRTDEARLLEPAAEIAVAAGDVAGARAHAERLMALADELRAPLLDAIAGRTDGRVALAEGDPRRALATLQRALATWRTLDAAYEVARTRVLVGQALRAVHDDASAAAEWAIARETFEGLGAAPDLAALDGIEAAAAGTGSEPGRSPVDPSSSAAGLTPREVEVLRLVAAGGTNRAVAQTLGISEKTVARHVSNVFDKLDVSSRAAATAWAYEHGLRGPTTTSSYPRRPDERLHDSSDARAGGSDLA